MILLSKADGNNSKCLGENLRMKRVCSDQEQLAISTI